MSLLIHQTIIIVCICVRACECDMDVATYDFKGNAENK